MKAMLKLTVRNLKQNKRRTIVTIIGVFLSTILMMSVGFLFSTFRENKLQDILRNKGDYHLKLTGISYENLEKLKSFSEIKQIQTELDLDVSDFSDYRRVSNHSTNPIFLRGITESPGITMEEGRLPKNEQEVILPFGLKYQLIVRVGDTIDLLGNKTVVGFYNHSQYEPYSSEDYSSNFYAYTKKVPQKEERAIFYVHLKSLKNCYDQVAKIGTSFGFKTKTEQLKQVYVTEYDHISVNRDLLELYGETENPIAFAIYFLGLFFTLVLLSIVCILVIYNSFAISVSERKKTLGIYASIGATPRQLLGSVFLEALLIGLLAIPLGILTSFFGIHLILWMFNQLLQGILIEPLQAAVYPFYVFLPILFLLVTILLSAFFPAMRAREVSPLEAIRGTQDIKVKKKEIKTSHWMNKLFGIEGMIALKNRKRNKKKYRITTLSIVTSIVFFITFSAIFNVIMDVTKLNNEDTLFAQLTIGGQEEQTYLHDLKALLPEAHMTIMKSMRIARGVDAAAVFDPVYQASNVYLGEGNLPFQVVALTSEEYSDYKKAIGLNTDTPIFINLISDREKDSFQTNDKWLTIYETVPQTWQFCDQNYSYNSETKTATLLLGDFCNEPFQVVTTKELPSSISSILFPTVVVSKELYHQWIYEILPDTAALLDTYSVRITTDDYISLDQKVKQLEEKYDLSSYFYENQGAGVQEQERIMLVIRFGAYLFLIFVTLIGVTSIFNTITTSISLRRREFAMLRSVGLSPRGFVKMMSLESLFFGVKSLLYGIPLSLGCVYLIAQILGLGNLALPDEQKYQFPFPTFYILFSIVFVFFIVFVTTMLSIRKIKKENIMNALEEEII